MFLNKVVTQNQIFFFLLKINIKIIHIEDLMKFTFISNQKRVIKMNILKINYIFIISTVFLTPAK